MTLEIVYFPAAGRAELLKLIAEYGGLEYKYTGVPRQDEWPKLKPNTRYGQLPYLKVNDDVDIYQTIAIARYLAQETKLYPEDRLKATLSEEYILAISDVLGKFFALSAITDEEAKKEEVKKIVEGPLRVTFGSLNQTLEKNGGYLVGEISWADFYLYEALQFLESRVNVTQEIPQWPILKKNIEGIEKIKSFLESDRNLKRIKQ
ncbi:hypothetical protein FDP41_004203 [Naegleria fowleri]|uniref:Glutathione S-transferase n=1 Tax=Naegleria fowleri TaxID=5763 RepID=A0A6A5BS31_NAEFO|nr:uncharacterized protein FDP41_004203 [Naegleria fowleri]KAF0976908.1 hypothetical protein FDP41_004203 [Naegleria fowleri]CAG4717777.1 unnamed protein product [Naegleria fowleri]